MVEPGGVTDDLRGGNENPDSWVFGIHHVSLPNPG